MATWSEIKIECCRPHADLQCWMDAWVGAAVYYACYIFCKRAEMEVIEQRDNCGGPRSLSASSLKDRAHGVQHAGVVVLAGAGYADKPSMSIPAVPSGVMCYALGKVTKRRLDSLTRGCPLRAFRDGGEAVRAAGRFMAQSG